jgi:hypothetical protein
MENERKVYRILVGKPEGKRLPYSEGQGVDGRMESEWILGGLAGGYGMDSVGSG